tara:strand:+ start:26287 stop:26598 length:312 start_codon:yes stop_codon:yes gene_type:complete
MIEIFLGVSIIFNGLLVWYIVQLLRKFLNISEELEGLFISLEEYSDHIELVHSLERFYGDSTLENLLRHSKELSSRSKNFRAIYDINYDIADDDEDQYEDEME